MTIIKRPLDPRRLRSTLPRGFGWIDHRFLTEGYLGRLSAHARGLYCLLVCAADRQGLSFYSNQRLLDLLAIDALTLSGARRELLESGLIAYQKPLCQVLAIDPGTRGAWPSTKPPGRALPALKPPLPQEPPPNPPPPPPLPAGLNLRAMVAASLREGGIV